MIWQRKAFSPRPRLRKRGMLHEAFQTILFVVVTIALANMATARAIVDGPSMEPTLFTGQFLLISRLHYLFGDVHNGDMVVFYPPGEDIRLLKRVVGSPGDTIEIREQQVYRNGQMLTEPYFINGPCTTFKCPDKSWTLGENEYFMMGDNRNHSRDSRVFGPVPKGNIIGRAIIRYFPIHRIRYFPTVNQIP